MGKSSCIPTGLDGLAPKAQVRGAAVVRDATPAVPGTAMAEPSLAWPAWPRVPRTGRSQPAERFLGLPVPLSTVNSRQENLENVRPAGRPA
jgi:hypothetical protein